LERCDFIFCRTISGQPRRAGDSKFKTDPVEALRCNGWFGFFSMTLPIEQDRFRERSEPSPATFFSSDRNRTYGDEHNK